MDGLRLKPYEEAALLNHYGLDALQPQVWTDAPETPVNGVERQLSKSSFAESSLAGPQSREQESGNWQYDDADPLGIKESILGRRTPSERQPDEFENGIYVSHKQFDPRLFLHKVHRGTPYKDLVIGAHRLRETVDQKADQLKELVRENLDRFVGAKNTVDTIYAEMKAKNFNPEELYGTRRFTEELIALMNDANRTFAPIMERRLRAERVRATLSVLERFRFFFNLPHSLLDSIKQNKFDVAVRDYKKGKSLMGMTAGTSVEPSTPPSASPLTMSLSSSPVDRTTASPNPAAPVPAILTLPSQQQKVFEKVRSAVEDTVVELRSILFRQLEYPWILLDVQERNIAYGHHSVGSVWLQRRLRPLDTVIRFAKFRYLLELDSNSDPAWYYIESQFKWIDSLLRNAYAEHARRASILHEQLQRDQERSSQYKAAFFKKALSSINSKDFELIFAKDKEVQIWRSIVKSVRTLSSILLQTLPDFWKLTRSYAEGKFQKHIPPAPGGDSRKRRMSVDPRRGERSLSMAKQLLELYAGLLTSTLSLPWPGGQGARPPMINVSVDGSPLDSFDAGGHHGTNRWGSTLQQGYGETVAQVPELPTGCSVLTCHFLTRIITELSYCFNDIKSAKLAPEVVSVMSSLMEKCRWTFVDIICSSWVKDAQNFYVHEDWIPDPDNGELTSLLKLFYRFQKYNARSAYRIANVVVILEDEMEERRNLTSMQMNRLSNAFFDSIYHLLDALHHLAFSEHAVLSGAEREESVFVKGKGDVSRMECRILIELSNLTYLKHKAIPRLVSMFEAAFKTAMNEEMEALNEIIDHLDGLLFDDYIKRKYMAIGEIVRNGFLFGGIDWATTSKPTEIHPFIYEALLAIVLVHAEVSDLSPSLVQRALAALLENFAQDMLEAVRSIHKFGLGGMLQATLEVEFVHQVLAKFVTAVAGSLLQLTYSTIESSVDTEEREVRDNSTKAADLQVELENVKELLAMCRRATAMQFLCFSE